MKTLSLRLSDELHTRSHRECERLGISLNALVSVALDAYLSQKKASGIEEIPLEASKWPSDGFSQSVAPEISAQRKKAPEAPKKGIAWPPVIHPVKRKSKSR